MPGYSDGASVADELLIAQLPDDVKAAIGRCLVEDTLAGVLDVTLEEPDCEQCEVYAHTLSANRNNLVSAYLIGHRRGITDAGSPGLHQPSPEVAASAVSHLLYE